MLRRRFLALLSLAPAAAAAAQPRLPTSQPVRLSAVVTDLKPGLDPHAGEPIAWTSTPATPLSVTAGRIHVEPFLLFRPGGRIPLPAGDILIPNPGLAGAMVRVSWRPDLEVYLAEPADTPVRPDVFIVGYVILPKA